MRKTIKLVLIIICMITIFNFSSDTSDKSDKKSNGLIVTVTEKVLRKKLTEKEQEQYISKYVTIVRKGAHFFIYSVLGFLIISYVHEYMPLNKKSIIISILIVFLYSCSDEIHQLFVSGRSGETRDVLIDTTGGALAITLYYYTSKIRRMFHE